MIGRKPLPLPTAFAAWHNIHTKRTNLVLDEELLEEAIRVLGVRTYSAAVNQSLADTVRRRKAEGLAEFFGRQLWEGDLAEMRQDRKNGKAP